MEIDRLLRRHWQDVMCKAWKILITEQLGIEDCFISADASSKIQHPVLGGQFQLSGNSLGMACFAGSFRSAPDWAVFNIQYPTAWYVHVHISLCPTILLLMMVSMSVRM